MVIDEVVTIARERQPVLTQTRLVCVDGPAGSGKTTLAARIVEKWPGSSETVHMDDLYEGWNGLVDSAPRVDRLIVAPLRTGEAGRYRRYDWAAAAWAEEHVVPVVDLLVIEGVGSGSPTYADAISCLVWVEADRDVRRSRGIERGGDEVREHWLTFERDEAALFRRERTRQRADVVFRT